MTKTELILYSRLVLTIVQFGHTLYQIIRMNT